MAGGELGRWSKSNRGGTACVMVIYGWRLVPKRVCIAAITSLKMARGLAVSAVGLGSVWETIWIELQDGFDGSILFTKSV